MNQEDRDRLIRIETNLANFMETVDKHVVGRVNDHGNRIRALEVLRYKAVGAMMLAGAIMGLGKDWLISKAKGHG